MIAKPFYHDPDYPIMEPASPAPPRLVTLSALRRGIQRLMAAYPRVGYSDWEWPPMADKAAWQTLKDRWLDCLEDMTDAEFEQAIDDHLAGPYAKLVPFPANLLVARDERQLAEIRGRDKIHDGAVPPSAPLVVGIPAPAPAVPEPSAIEKPPLPLEPDKAARQEDQTKVSTWAEQAKEEIRKAAARKPQRGGQHGTVTPREV